VITLATTTKLQSLAQFVIHQTKLLLSFFKTHHVLLALMHGLQLTLTFLLVPTIIIYMMSSALILIHPLYLLSIKNLFKMILMEEIITMVEL